MNTVGPQQLRNLLSTDRVIIAPGAMNALVARLIQQVGFEAIYFSGAAFANTVLAVPDLGLATLSEMVQHLGYISQAVTIPVIADGDTGFGSVLNVQRAVTLYEGAGAAAIQIEDQTMPKRCGHFKDKQVVEMSEMIARIRAALAARADPNFVVIARTDARSVTGLEDALKRCAAYATAGADMLFLEAPESDEELSLIGRELKGVPLVANMVEGGRTPLHSAAELASMGFQLVIFPGLTRVAVFAVLDALKTLSAHGDSRALLQRLVPLSDVNDRLGLQELLDRAALLEGEPDAARA